MNDETYREKIKNAVKQKARELSGLLTNNAGVRIGENFTWDEHWALVSKLDEIARNEETTTEDVKISTQALKAVIEEILLNPVDTREKNPNPTYYKLRDWVRKIAKEEMAKAVEKTIELYKYHEKIYHRP